jgi:hypothetical protein
MMGLADLREQSIPDPVGLLKGVIFSIVHTLDINFLSGLQFAHIFSFSVIFCCVKLFSLLQNYLCILVFVFCALRVMYSVLK